MERILSALAINSTRATLILVGNSLKDEGVAWLAEALQVNSALTILDLANIKIGAAGQYGWRRHSRSTSPNSF